MMTQGNIRISRSITDWRWYDNPIMVYVWLHLLLMANWRDKEWHDKVIKRGSFVTTLSSLSGQLNLSFQQVRTCLDRLKSGGEIKTTSSNSFTIITICKYDDYQCSITNEQQTNNKPITTTEEYNTSDTKVSSYSIQEEKKEKNKEEDTVVSSEKEHRHSLDFDYILKLWNDSARRSIPKVRSLSKERKEKIKLRVAEMGGWEKARDILSECFVKLGESDFCNGSNGIWVANIDWFFKNSQNWLKVLEGNYDNRQQKSQLEILAENVAKADAYYEQRYHGYGGASPYGNQTGGGPYGPDEQ